MYICDEEYREWCNNINKEYGDFTKKWRENHPLSISIEEKRLNHKEKMKIWQNNKWRTDLKYKLNKTIRYQISFSLKGNKEGKHWEDLVGYSVSDLIKHLQKTMPKGYNWNDYLEGKLHIDHIVPVSVFNYTDYNHTDFKRCWSLSNLQLLPARENLIKKAKLCKPFQPALKI